MGWWKVEYSMFFGKWPPRYCLPSDAPDSSACEPPELLCDQVTHGTNQHQSGWQGWKRIDGKGWAGWWQHLEDVTQWEGGEFGKQDKHRRVANGKTKVLLSGTEKNNAKTGLENKQGNKTLINKPRKKTTVCIVYNNLKMERWLTSCLQPL